MTPSFRRRRNLDILRCHRAGIGLRALARLTRLSTTQIARILDDLEMEAGEQTERLEIVATVGRIDS
jgi:hypothetical protein